MNSFRKLLVLLGLGALVASINGTLVLSSFGIIPSNIWFSVWLTCWLGDLVGIMVLASCLYCWWQDPYVRLPKGQSLELALVTALTLLVAEIIFGGLIKSEVIDSLPYLIIPGLLLSAFRFGPREASTLTLLVAILAIGNNWHFTHQSSQSSMGLMPFLGRTTSPSHALLIVQIFILALSSTTIVLAAAISDKNSTEHALSESEKHLRTIFDQVPVGVALVDVKTGRFIRINQKYCDLVGYSQEEMKAKTFLDITYSEDLKKDTMGLKKLLEGSAHAYTTEKRYVRKDGSLIFVNLSVSATLNPGETPLYNVTIAEDISERVKSRMELAESTARFQALVESLPQLIWTSNPDGRLDFVNERWREFTGMDLEQTNSPDRMSLVHADDLNEMMEKWQFSIQSGQSFESKYRLNYRGVGYRWVLARAVPILDADGKILRWVGSSTDIHEQILSEMNLLESELRLRLALEAANLNPWEFDIAQGSHQSHFNLADSVGLEPGASIAVAELRSRIHPDDLAQNIQKMDTAIKNIVPFRDEFRMMEPNGEIRWILSHGRIMCDSQGSPLRIMGVSEDITKRKDQELNLKQLNATLELRVAERTAEAEKRSAELARSNIELEQFAYIASHDLQEPLRAVASYVGLLAKRYSGQMDARADQYIRHAVEGASRMQAFINDLLTYSRIRGTNDERVWVDTGKILNEVLEDLQTAIDDSSAHIEIEPLPNIYGFPHLMRQLFLNLITNAIKFRSEAPLRIRIAVCTLSDEARFCVEDNGIGFESKHSERIFLIFQRLHTREKYQGTGLGLAICKKVASYHGGQIWGDSIPGSGSKFFFTIPMVKPV